MVASALLAPLMLEPAETPRTGYWAAGPMVTLGRWSYTGCSSGTWRPGHSLPDHQAVPLSTYPTVLMLTLIFG